MAHSPRVVHKRKSLITVVVRQNVLVGSACGKDSTFDAFRVHHHADQLGLVLDEVFPVPCRQNEYGDEIVEEVVDEINIVLALDPSAAWAVQAEAYPRLSRIGSAQGESATGRCRRRTLLACF